ncbi:MAG: 1-deoxy-D-xylulose-5-phosphate synthase [Bacilli bacterium]|nr:1-deoxy-D-xylulose-5-phosphate synthase [Bacilli bacterium]
MVLDKINKTNDIKKIDQKEKKILAQEIRDYLIDVTSKNGGHLASNLGVVELTIALESVFDLKKDKIIWDVGHQCYVHKILNGRKEELKSIRKLNGISGFPKTSESETDCFNTGHSSTSISAAMGMAKARDLKQKENHVIAVIGDGALTGGMALEALNHVGCTQTKMIIILNDNEMSISKNISGMNKLLTRLRSKKTYRKTNREGRKIISSIPLLGKPITKIVSKGKNAVKQVFVPGMYFEESGIKYLGPVDGHNIEAMEHLLEKAKSIEEPVLIHVLTKKGKGYLPAEENPSKFHGIGPFDKLTGETIGKKKKDYSKVFGEKLVSIAKRNKKVVAITAAMRDGTGLSLFAEEFPERFFDVGIAEQHAITFAAGLAKEGMIPVVNIYSSFYQRAYDQVIHDVCAQNLPVVMVVDRAGIVGADGETHQGIFDMSFFKIIPNLTIMCPKDFQELEMMMDHAIELKRPVVIRIPRGGESSTTFEKNKRLQLGKCEVIKDGNDITLIGIGKTVSKVTEIGNILEKDGIHSEVINVRYLKPLDKNTIKDSIRKTKKVVVVEDSTLIGGLSSSIKELIAEENIVLENSFYYAYQDKFIPHGTPEELEKKYKVDIEKIIEDIKGE